MATPSAGAQHYVLLLIPNLVRDMERLGLRHIIEQTSLPEQDVTSLYFQTKSISQSLPDHPENIDSTLWPALLERAKIMTLIVGELSREELLKAKDQAIQNFLPQARQKIQAEFQRRLEGGDVDFRLAGLSRQRASPERAEATCMEAIKLERQRCYESLMQVRTDQLNTHQAKLVSDAKTYVEECTLNPSDDCSSVDLLIHLGTLLNSLLVLKQHPDLAGHQDVADANIDHVVMGMGNILYRGELGLNMRPSKWEGVQ